MLSVGEGFSAPTRLERLSVFTTFEYSRGAIIHAVTHQSGTPESRKRADSRGLALGLLVAVGILFFLIHLGFGSTNFVSPLQVVKELLRGRTNSDDSVNTVVWAIRLPKALYCVLAGGMLGVVGSAFQAVFRNPLAEPYTVGVSSGAAVGGVIAQLLGLDFVFFGLGTPILGFVGGMLSLLLVFGLVRKRGVVDVTHLLLAGVVVGALLSAILSILILMSGSDTNRLMQWLLGSTSPAFWVRVWLMLILLVGGTWVLRGQTRQLNALAIGEDTAARLGIDPNRLKWVVLSVGTAMAATTVGTVGAIAFLGLVAPHISRRILGVDWRWSLMGSLVVGAALMLAADVVAQRGLPWLGHLLTGKELLATELPIGAVTALFGAPSLLILLRKGERA